MLSCQVVVAFKLPLGYNPMIPIFLMSYVLCQNAYAIVISCVVYFSISSFPFYYFFFLFFHSDFSCFFQFQEMANFVLLLL